VLGACLLLILVPVTAKMVAAILGIVKQAQRGGEIAAALRRGDRDADERFHRLVYESNPIDRWLYHLTAGKTRRWLARLFWAPVTTTLAAVGLILADGSSSRHLFGGMSAVVVVALAIVTAAMLRLIWSRPLYGGSSLGRMTRARGTWRAVAALPPIQLRRRQFSNSGPYS
jgi:hypothetical protein